MSANGQKNILHTTTSLLSVIDSLNGNRAKCQEKHAHFLFAFERAFHTVRIVWGLLHNQIKK